MSGLVFDAAGRPTNGRPMPHEETKPKGESPAILVGRYLGQQAALYVDQEIREYAVRNHIPPGEISAEIVGFNKNPRLVRVGLEHKISGTPIVGSPRRTFSIGLIIGAK